MKKRKSGGEDCGSWMDTYGDMVTLLLCPAVFHVYAG